MASFTEPDWLRRHRRLATVQIRAAWGHRDWLLDRGAQVAIVVGLVLIVVGTAGFLGVYDAVQEVDDLAELDTPVLEGLVAARSDPLTATLTVITTITGPETLPVLVLVGALAWGLLGKQWWQSILLAGAMIASTLVAVTIKDVVARPRPPVGTMTVAGVESTYSFPSGTPSAQPRCSSWSGTWPGSVDRGSARSCSGSA